MHSARKRVVLRELDPDRGWRSATTKVQEAVTTFFGYNVGERVRVLPISAFTEVLERGGFQSRVEPSWGSTCSVLPSRKNALLVTSVGFGR